MLGNTTVQTPVRRPRRRRMREIAETQPVPNSDRVSEFNSLIAGLAGLEDAAGPTIKFQLDPCWKYFCRGGHERFVLAWNVGKVLSAKKRARGTVTYFHTDRREGQSPISTPMIQGH